MKTAHVHWYECDPMKPYQVRSNCWFLGYALVRSMELNGISGMEWSVHDRGTHFRLQLDKLRRHTMTRKVNNFATFDIPKRYFLDPSVANANLMRDTLLEWLIATHHHREAKYKRKHP